jgi:cytochrome c553
MSFFKIALSIAVASLLVGCGEDNTTAKTAQNVVEQKTEQVVKSVDDATKAAEVVVKEAAKETQAAVTETKSAVADVAKAVDESTKEAVAQVKEAAQEATVKVEEVVAVATTSSGADLYKVCASCHGQNAEKPALGKSQIIKGWEASKIAAALHGYKDGTYGGAMKSVMKGQVSKLSDADIVAVSEYISKL